MRLLKTVDLLIAIALYLFASFCTAGYNKTEDYWQCENKVGGGWTFGRAPYACDVKPFGDVDYVSDTFSSIIFSDNEAKKAESTKYMTALYPVIRDISNYYLKSRKGNASQTELKAWQHAIFTVAHQESFWSHYRIATDNKLKMMRGDSGHGHGLMQIDDRWHFVAINDGKGWNVITNLLYAMDEYFGGWQKAADANCLSSASQWRNRARAAYSYYNGGPSKVCRWSNESDKWARNDKNYADKYDNKAWESYVTDLDAPTTIDVVCLAEKNESCSNDTNPGANWDDNLLILADDSACIWRDSALHCVAEQRDALCLQLIGDFDAANKLQLDDKAIDGMAINLYDRHECPKHMDGLFAVTDFIELKKSINVRTTPGGTKLGLAPSGTTVQILDFELKDQSKLKRYYRIRIDGKYGYVYAGDKTNYESWATRVTTHGDDVVIPVPDQGINVTSTNGINLRQTPGGKKIGAIPLNTAVTVLQTHVQDTDNAIYYKLEYQGKQGYIYGGHLLPEATLEQWAKLHQDSQPVPTQRAGTGASNMWYVFLKSCGQDKCKSTGNYLVGGFLDNYCSRRMCSYRKDRVVELDSGDNNWIKIRLERDGGEGWVQDDKIDWD